MAKHILRLRYEGLAADDGGIGTSSSKQVITGAQMLLGSHAHYFLTGNVPDRINDRSAGYDIVHLGRERGSHVADFAINILANGVYEVAKVGFCYLVMESYRAWSEQRLYEDPPYDRIEPYLDVPRSNAPFFDDVDERRRQRSRLSQRVGKSMSQITAPNGVYSSRLEMSIDGKVFATVTRRFYDEDDIAEAVQLLKYPHSTSRRII